MNEPHENLDHDPFADDARRRRRPRLRRDGERRVRLAARERCAEAAFASATRRRGPLR
jgi:hypothetical protein